MSKYERIAATLRTRVPVDDAEFDAVYSPALRRASERHWTPVHVALRAALWLTATGARRVLDIGAGPGKLCIVGALASEAEFIGVEQREHLVDAGREAARVFGVAERVTLLHDVIENVDIATFDALYLFNPFGENLRQHDVQVDRTVELSYERHQRDVETVERAITAMPVGGRIVTYYGFGGRVPDTFDFGAVKDVGTGILRLWVKARPASEQRSFYLESTDAEFSATDFSDF